MAEESWAQRTLKTLSLEEKIGQLFWVAAYVDPDFAEREKQDPHIEPFITDYHVGGLVFVGPSTCAKQVELTDHYQSLSRLPLLIAQDLEWGLAMRIQEGTRFPKNRTLGFVKDNTLIYAMGREIGRQARLVGVHMNLSPVLDVNTEENNPAINVRSFGPSPQEVADKGVAMIRGLQDSGILASAKHFPGLGAMTVDPHLGLPRCDKWQESDLIPFAQAIQAGVISIQNEHVIVPPFALPASLSYEMVTHLLKEQLGFQGLILSGALRMKALTEHFSIEQIVLGAFRAGNDILMMPQDLVVAYECVKQAVLEGKIAETEIDARVLKSLQLKEHLPRYVEVPALEELNPIAAQELKQRLFQSAVHVVRDENTLLPVDDMVVSLQLRGALSLDTHALEACSKIVLSVYPEDPRKIVQIRLLDKTEQAQALVAFRVHGLTEPMVQALKQLEPYAHKTIVVLFGNEGGLPFFAAYPTIILAHENDPEAEAAAAALLYRITMTVVGCSL